MKSIRQKILFFILAPFFAIYAALSLYIIFHVYRVSLTGHFAWSNAIPVLLPIGLSFVINLVIFTFLFMYLSRGIAVPIKKLAEAGEDIVSGNVGMHISVVNSRDELGMISKSLFSMSEQFRTEKLLQERYSSRFDMLLKLHYALFRSVTLKDAFTAALTTISEYFDAYKSLLVFVINDSPTIVAVYPVTDRDEGDSGFFAHGHVKQLLEGKKLLAMNGSVLETAELPFIDYYAKSLCILPLRTGETLLGYIIMEGKKQKTLISDDTTLLFLGDALSYILRSKVNWEQEIAEKKEPSGNIFSISGQESSQEFYITEDDNAFLEKAKTIQNLNVEKGIFLIGGEKKEYTELLKVTIKVISEAILKMRRLYIDNLPAFAIEIHGTKAALLNIGAEVLGDEARQLEFAVKSDDAEYCRKNYPPFEEKLRAFSRNLASLFPQQERNYRKGAVEELEKVLMQVQEACDNFDISTINSLLAPLAVLKWDDAKIQNSLQGIMLDMENLEYDGIANKISCLLETLKDREK